MLKTATSAAAISLALITSTSAFAGNCPEHPKYPQGQCAKAVGGTCQFRNSGWHWWTTNGAQQVKYHECLRRMGAE
jgi:hypothetical protein